METKADMENNKPTKLEKKLHALNKKYDALKARIQNLGFICRGSLTKRHLTCGSPNCRCHKDRKMLHGPYYQVSWKEKGKSVSHFIAPELVPLYQQWLANRRALDRLTIEMQNISRQAAECVRFMQDRENKRSSRANDPLGKSR